MEGLRLTGSQRDWGAIATSAATLSRAQEEYLNAHRVGYLATVDGRGNPHNVPVCFAVYEGRIYISIDQKPKSVAPDDLQRMRNIRLNPAVCLVVDEYDDQDWSRLSWLQIRGTAGTVPREAVEERTGALKLLRERYANYRSMALEQRPLLCITAARVVGWSAATG